jgi:hypothetical protein
MAKGSRGAAAAGAGAGALGGFNGFNLLGLFGVNTNIHCDASDNSFYCSIMKIFNFLMVAFFVAIVLYIIYNMWRGAAVARKRR